MINHMNIQLTDDAVTPVKGHADDAGIDLKATTCGVVPAHGLAIFKTGVKAYIPRGYVGMLTSKSGLMLNGITSRGTIDHGYKGEIAAILFNHSDVDYKVNRGDKITQLVLFPIANVDLVLDIVQEKDERGSNGFGSTGK